MIRAVLFDVDGVLVDTAELHEKATSEAAGTFVDCSGGGSTQCKLRRAGFNEQEIEQIYPHKTELYHDLVLSLSPDPDLVNMVSQLRDRYKVAACSNSSKVGCHTVLQRTGLYPLMHTVVTGGDVKRLKPHPDIYLEAMGRFCIQPQNCIVFEDSDEGAKAAVEAGVDLVIRCDVTTIKREVRRWLL